MPYDSLQNVLNILGDIPLNVYDRIMGRGVNPSYRVFKSYCLSKGVHYTGSRGNYTGVYHDWETTPRIVTGKRR